MGRCAVIWEDVFACFDAGSTVLKAFNSHDAGPTYSS